MRARPLHAVSLLMAGLWVLAAGGACAQIQGGQDEVRAIGIPYSSSTEDKINAVWSQPVGPSQEAYAQFERYAAQGDWRAASQYVSELTKSYPLWRVPNGMKRRVSAGLTDLQIRDAVSDKDWQRVLYYLGDAREGACENNYTFWARLDALAGLGDARELKTVLPKSLPNCSQDVQIALLGRAAQSLGADDIEDILKLPVWQDANLSDELRTALANVEASVVRQRYDHLRATQGGVAASELALASQDIVLQRQAAWDVLESDPAKAVTLFETVERAQGTPEGRYGLGLAYFRNKDFNKALAVLADQSFDFGIHAKDAKKLSGQIYFELSAEVEASGRTYEAVALALKGGESFPQLQPEAESRAGAIWLAASQRAFDSGNYAEAEDAARKAMLYASTERQGQARLAWIEVQSGKPKRALANFQSLYEDRPDAEMMEGAVLSAQKAGQLKRLYSDQALAPELRAAAASQLSRSALVRGEFYSAQYYDPDIDPRLEGLSGLAVTQTVSVRKQDGGDVDGEVLATTSRTEASWGVGSNRIAVGLVALKTDEPDAARVANVQDEALWSPYAKLTHEGDITVEAEIGTTPIGADISPELIGAVAGRVQTEDAFVEGELFRSGRRDSALALYGTQSTNAQPAYGRVVESGASVRLRKHISEQIMAGVGLTASALEGRNVASNSRVDVMLHASRNVPLEAFSYFSTGPFVEVDSYDRNLNAYTPGYGGYFSPQKFTRVGWSLNFLTRELEKTLVQGDMSIAHESIEQDPLYGVGGNQMRSKSSALAGALNVSAGRMLNDKWILVGHVAGISSKTFEDVQLGIALTYIPGGRKGLIRQDLTPDPFAQDLWTR